MKLTVLKENVHKPLALASRYISSRPAIPVLANVLIEAQPDLLVLSSTNLDITLKIQIPAQVHQTGSTTLPAKTFYELINNLPSGKIDIEIQDDQLVVTSDKNRTVFNTITAEDFPVLPKFHQDNAIQLSITLLRQVSDQVLLAASSDDSRPILTTILLKQQDQYMTFVATDGYRLSEMTRQVEGQLLEEGRILLLPAKIVSELIKIGTDNNSDALWIDITTQTNQLAMKTAEVEFYSKLINGTYPPYERIIPTDFKTTVELDSSELYQAIRLASIFARDTGSQVRFDINPDQSLFTVAAHSTGLGQNSTTVSSTLQGAPIEISFNSKYLLDILNVLPDGPLKLQFRNAESPVMVTSDQLPNFKHIIMPLRI